MAMAMGGIGSYSGEYINILRQQLAEQQEYMDIWNDTFGPVQTNVANYFSKLTPDKFVADKLKTYGRQYQTSLKNVNQQLAQQGLAGGGLQQDINAQMEMQRARDVSEIRANAPAEVAAQQADFLNLGLQEKTSALGRVSTAQSNLASGLYQAEQAALERQQTLFNQGITAQTTASNLALAAAIDRRAEVGLAADLGQQDYLNRLNAAQTQAQASGQTVENILNLSTAYGDWYTKTYDEGAE
jgi:7,8-dihydro-6-hydroxymethylpterin-pyrophosphokinase